MEYEKLFRHGTTSPNIYSFTQLNGVSSSGLIDFSCRITWSVTSFQGHGKAEPYVKDCQKPRWERNMYGCNCNVVPKTFSPVLVYSETSKDKGTSCKYSSKHHLVNRPNSHQTPELRQRLLLNTQYYQGANLYYRGEASTKFTDVPPYDKIFDSADEDQTTDKKSRKYKCQYCNVTCTNNGQLKGHLRVHTGEKPFRCDYVNCDRSFARNEELTRHRRIHSGIRPHHCQTCGKYFGRKDHLNKHLKTHLKTAEKKNYICIVSGCGQRYTRSDALARHQWSTHGIKPKTTKYKQTNNC